jgi:hypothetical protein
MENLPIEIQWNIIKFMRHHVADAFLIASANIPDPTKPEFGYDPEYSFAGVWFEVKTWERRNMINAMPISIKIKHLLLSKIERNYWLYEEKYCPEVEHANSDYGN